MSEFQIVQPNTWTPLVGTDVEVLVDGVDRDVCVDAELYRNDRGEQLVEFSIAAHADAKIVVRAPKTDLAWPQG